jgi:hypothetical protein
MDADNTDLKTFVLLAKTAKGAAAAALIQQVLDHPSVNVFGELLDMPNMQEVRAPAAREAPSARAPLCARPRASSAPQLAGGPSAGSLELLRVFAFGTWSDYKARASALPPLNEVQATKLKKLTVVHLAAQGKLLAYDALIRELEVRALHRCRCRCRRRSTRTMRARAAPRRGRHTAGLPRARARRRVPLALTAPRTPSARRRLFSVRSSCLLLAARLSDLCSVSCGRCRVMRLCRRR